MERPEAAVLALVLAAVSALGWSGTPLWLAVAVGVQLALAGLGAVWIIGPASSGLGFARYATLATATVALTLFGRAVVDSAGLLLVPLIAVALWGVLRVELELERSGRGGWLLELAMVGLVFCAAEGAAALAPADAWPAALGLLMLASLVPAIRLTEARGRYGVQAVGQAVFLLLALAQVAAGVRLLGVPQLVAAALVALTFHAWNGAAEALEGRTSGRSVAIEYGSLAALGLVVALLLHGI